MMEYVYIKNEYIYIYIYIFILIVAIVDNLDLCTRNGSGIELENK